MTGASGQDRNITRLDAHGPALQSAKLHLALAACDAEHLVNAGVIVNVIVNAVRQESPIRCARTIPRTRRRDQKRRRAEPRCDRSLAASADGWG